MWSFPVNRQGRGYLSQIRMELKAFTDMEFHFVVERAAGRKQGECYCAFMYCYNLKKTAKRYECHFCENSQPNIFFFLLSQLCFHGCKTN